MPKTKRNIARKAKRSTSNHPKPARNAKTQRTEPCPLGQGHTQQSAPAVVAEHSPIPETPSGLVSQQPLGTIFAGNSAEPEGLVLSAQVEGLGIQTERSETMEHPRLADATPSGHTVPVGRDLPEAERHTVEDPRAQRNRQNAQHSTGPRTEEGKARSAQNARKHGLSSARHVILEGEDPADYEALRAEILEVYVPLSKREELAVEDIAKARWSVRRCEVAEATCLNFLVRPILTETDGPRPSCGSNLGCSALAFEVGKVEKATNEMEYWPALERIARYRATHERRLQRAIQEFDRARADRRAEATEQRKQEQALHRREDQRRKQEAHELRMAFLEEKLTRERRRTVKTAPPSAEDSTPDPLQAAFEELLKTPPPGLSTEQLAGLGFVSSEALTADGEAKAESEGWEREAA